uniref:Uncharacterized protein n=1 Tax=Anguilla anguilla TaxID=7936 RepID=A0A0E9WCV6_ANGAN
MARVRILTHTRFKVVHYADHAVREPSDICQKQHKNREAVCTEVPQKTLIICSHCQILKSGVSNFSPGGR